MSKRDQRLVKLILVLAAAEFVLLLVAACGHNSY
jgi:hypothetical protein